MGRMNDASIMLEDMVSWSTDELMVAWCTSDDPVERYAAQHLVRARAADMIELSTELQAFGKANPGKMKQQ